MLFLLFFDLFQIARNPGSQPIDQIIRDRQMQEEQRRIADEQDRTRRLNDIRSTWEKESNNKIKVNTIKRRVQDMMKTNDMMLEERRERFVYKYLIMLQNSNPTLTQVQILTQSRRM